MWESHPHWPVIYYLCDERIPPKLLSGESRRIKSRGNVRGITPHSVMSEEVLGRDVADDVVITTYDDVLVITGLLLQHFALGNLEALRNLLYHLLVLSA